MTKLTTKRRKALPTTKFALPRERKYPVDTKNRAENAKARAQQQYEKGNLSRAQLLQIERAANRVIRARGGKAAPPSTKRAAKSGKRRA